MQYLMKDIWKQSRASRGPNSDKTYPFFPLPEQLNICAKHYNSSVHERLNALLNKVGAVQIQIALQGTTAWIKSLKRDF